MDEPQRLTPERGPASAAEHFGLTTDEVGAMGFIVRSLVFGRSGGEREGVGTDTPAHILENA